jgi:ABC-type amino acid transport substrate-binding protein
MRLLAATFAALVLAAPAAAAPVTETVSSGSVSAEFSYERDGQDYSGFHVKITHDGAVLWNRDLPAGCKDPCGVRPAYSVSKKDSVRLRDLDGDRDPEVIVDLFTGGAHCCLASTIYSFEEGGGKYTPLRHDWKDAGYRLVGSELRSRDARFAYRFASYAESYLPIQIFDFRDGALKDVTKTHRRLLRKDATSAYKLYKRQRGRAGINLRGVLAAYAADRYRLGQRKGARAVLRAAVARGDADEAFLGQVDRFLKKIKYTGR